MLAIDTNVVVRILVRDDERQADMADAFIEGGAWVSLLVLTESSWVLRNNYGVSSHQLAEMIELLLCHRDLVLQDADSVAAALKMLRAKPSLGFSDCLILECARKAGHLPLGTFDRKLAKSNGAQLL